MCEDPLDIRNLARWYLGIPAWEIDVAVQRHPNLEPGDAMVVECLIYREQLEWLRSKQESMRSKKPASVDVRHMLEHAARGAGKIGVDIADACKRVADLMAHR